MASSSSTKPDIVLHSPVGSKPAVYKWPLKINGCEEIIQTIKWVAKEYEEFKPAIENILPEQPDYKSYDFMKNLAEKYNRIPELVMRLNKGTSIALKTSSRASEGLLKYIIQQVYEYAVAEPNELNRYSPFSSETYGETSFEFMAQLIEKNHFKPREDDIFVDLGSGVGHLVLQMAGTVECKKCYGIEIAEKPADYAKVMEERFKFWMNWHGKTYTPFELIHGDFFEKKYCEIIKNANFIFVNNFAFKPDDDHKLKQRFLDLKDGTQIVSSKPFCSLRKRMTQRNLTDIGSIMHVVDIQPVQKKDSVSWTPKPLPYYLHVLDGSKVERYYEKQKRRQCTSIEGGRPNKRKRPGNSGSDLLDDDSDDNTVYGPTTRKAWSEWCNASSNRTSTDSGKTASSATTEYVPQSAISPENLNVKPKETETPKREKRILESTTTESSNTKPKESEAPPAQKKTVESATTETRTTTKQKESEPPKREKRASTSASTSQKTQSNHTPKSCLDKKRDYAIKKGGSNLLQNASPSSLYSIAKPADGGASSSSVPKVPSIVIKVKTSGSAKPGKLTTTKKKAPSPDKKSSLELLHAKTVESISVRHSSHPAPGCEDHNLKSITDTPSLPKVVIKDLSEYVSALLGPKKVENFANNVKLDLNKFAQMIQAPHARDALLKNIKLERLRSYELKTREENLRKNIKFLNDRIPLAIKSHTDLFGIENNQTSIIRELGASLQKHQDLLAYISQLESSIQPKQTMFPPAAHSNNNRRLASSGEMSTATLDLSLGKTH